MTVPSVKHIKWTSGFGGELTSDMHALCKRTPQFTKKKNPKNYLN